MNCHAGLTGQHERVLHDQIHAPNNLNLGRGGEVWSNAGAFCGQLLSCIHTYCHDAIEQECEM